MAEADLASMGRRERKKLQTRQALEAAALRLFVSKGFDGTTLEDITEAADVSPRTFFRYFDSKEGVLFSRGQELMDALRKALAERPAEEDVLIGVRESLQTLARLQHADREHNLLRARISLESPEIQGRAAQATRDWEGVIADWLRMRLDVGRDDIRPDLVAGACVAALRTAITHWMAAGGVRELPEEVDAALDLLQQGIDTITRRPATT